MKVAEKMLKKEYYVDHSGKVSIFVSQRIKKLQGKYIFMTIFGQKLTQKWKCPEKFSKVNITMLIILGKF